MMIEGKSKISFKSWGNHQGKEVMLFRIENRSGAFVELTNYGATVVSVFVPDKRGELDNVILGYSSFQGYLNDSCYIGSTIGRFANRIGEARFTLDGVVYELEKNDGVNTNHGGTSGLHAKVFDYTVEEDTIKFSVLSKDGEGGYPGNVEINIEYCWNDSNELNILYTAQSDKRTVMNFTNHAYFNLSPKHDDIFNHALMIDASQILETTKEYIPTGEILPAGDKAFHGHKINERTRLVKGVTEGLNSYYIFDTDRSGNDNAMCRLTDDASGRVLEVFTTYPGVQLYTGDFLMSLYPNNRSSFHKPFDGLCLECQGYPDSPNHSHFPSTVMDAGYISNERITYRFTVEK